MSWCLVCKLESVLHSPAQTKENTLFSRRVFFPDMAQCLNRTDAQRPFGGSEKQKSDICVSVTLRYGVLKMWALVPQEAPGDRVQPEGFTWVLLLWMMISTCLSLSTFDPERPFFSEGFSTSSTQLVQRDFLLLSPYCCFPTLATSISLGISLGQKL